MNKEYMNKEYIKYGYVLKEFDSLSSSFFLFVHTMSPLVQKECQYVIHIRKVKFVG